MRLFSTAIVTALGLSVAACGANTANRTIESERQPVVSRSHYVLDLNIGGAGSLASSEQRRLAGWFDAIDLGYGDRVSIDDPSYSSSAAARGAVEAMVSNYGLLVSEVAPVTQGNVPSGAIRVVVSRSSVSVPGCPDWSHRSHTDFQGRTSANYGCGTNSTLAAMMADPEDLVRGQHSNEQNQAEASKAIKAYREKAKSAGGQ